MKAVFSIVWADMRMHWVRMLLTVIGVGAATGAVVWSYGSYATKKAQSGAHAKTLLGKYTHWVGFTDPSAPTGRRGGRGPSNLTIPQKTVLALGADKRVKIFDPVHQESLRVLSRDSKGNMKRNGPPMRAVVSATKALAPPGTDTGIEGRWIDQDNLDAREAVMVASTAQTLRIHVGDKLFVAGPTSGELALTVVGLLPCELSRWDMPSGYPTVYVTHATMNDVLGKEGDALKETLPINSAYLAVAQDSVASFEQEWKTRIRESKAYLSNASDLSGQLQLSGSRFDIQGLYIVGLAFLGSLFVIFTTLNIGFGERVRQLALLRSIGLPRRGVAMLILVEGMITGAAGFVLSLPIGGLILWITTLLKPAIFPEGVALDGYAVGLAALASLVGALLASLLPAWLSMRLKPLDAMNRPVTSASGTTRWWLGLVGLLLIVVSQWIVFGMNFEPMMQVTLSSVVGLPLLAVGVILLIPAILRFVDMLLSPVIAKMFRLPPDLAAQDLSRNSWRSVGVVLAISIGLGLFISLQTWGYTMLKPFQPTERIPDLIFSFGPDGIPNDQIEAIRKVNGIDPDRCMALTTRQYHFGPRTIEKVEAIWGASNTDGPHGASAADKPNVLVVGFDVEQGLAGDNPVIGFEYRDSTRVQVLERMRKGGHCLISEALANLTGLKAGDTFTVDSLYPYDRPTATAGRRGGRGGRGAPRAKPADGSSAKPASREGRGGRKPGAEAKTAPARGGAASGEKRIFHTKLEEQAREKGFVVAGVYTEPWHLLTGWTGMRGLYGGPFRTNGLMLVGKKDGLALHKEERTVFFWANRTPEFNAMEAGDSMAKIREGLESVVAAQTPHYYQAPGAAAPVLVKMPLLRLRTQEFLMQNCLSHANDIINRLSQLPIFALLISTLAVANTIMASVRARRWELGLLRSLGLTRIRLLRLLVAESMLIALAATIASLIFGVIAGNCVTGVAKVSSWTRAMPIELVIPWTHIAVGVVITFGIALVATAWPALSTARKEPLGLLQEGRSSI